MKMNSELRTSAENQAHDLAGREEWREAATVLLPVAQAEPGDTQRWLQIANWQRRGGDAKAAIETLETALRLNSQALCNPKRSKDSVALWLALAESQFEAQNWELCASACNILLQISPGHHAALELQATALLQLNQTADAEIAIRALLSISPLDPLHRLRLATLLQLQGKLGEATREFERTIEMHGHLPLVIEAYGAMENLERMQTQQVLMLASERLDFRRLLETDIIEALDSLGFYLSENALESLQHTVWDGSFFEEELPRLH